MIRTARHEVLRDASNGPIDGVDIGARVTPVSRPLRKGAGRAQPIVAAVDTDESNVLDVRRIEVSRGIPGVHGTTDNIALKGVTLCTVITKRPLAFRQAAAEHAA